MFYHHNGRLSFTNGLIIVPDGEVPDGMEKTNLRNSYQMFKDTKSHGIVYFHFLCWLGTFFGLGPLIRKYALTEFYQNLSYETLSETKIHEFESVSDLISELNFSIKRSTLANMKRKGKKDEKSIQEIEKTRNSVEKPDGFSEDITDGLFKDLEHKKVNIRMLNFKSKMQKQ